MDGQSLPISRFGRISGEDFSRLKLRISDEDGAKTNLSSSPPLPFNVWAGILWMLPFEGSSRYLDGGYVWRFH